MCVSESHWDSVRIYQMSINVGPLKKSVVLYIIDWNSVNFHWILETLTDSNLECEMETV